MSFRVRSAVVLLIVFATVACDRSTTENPGERPTGANPDSQPSSTHPTAQPAETSPSPLVTEGPRDGGIGAGVSSGAGRPPPDHPFVHRDGFTDCVHPGVVTDCRGGWCRIPAGCFVLGSPPDEPSRARYTEEFARVTLTQDFEIQQAELTLEEWRKTGWEDPNGQWTKGLPDDPNRQYWDPCTDPQCPANSTTWYQALEYANWLSEQRGLAPCFRVFDCAQRLDSPAFGLACKTELLAETVYQCEGYRLPTSAEWEYAARAGTTAAFYSGEITSFKNDYTCNDDPNLSPIAWYCANAEPPEKPVGRLLPNPWGLNDVLGNVIEWTVERSRGTATPDPSTDPAGRWDDGGGATTRSCAVHGRHVLCRSAAGLDGARDSRFAGIRLVRTLGKGTLPTLDDIPQPDADAAPADPSP